MGAGQPQLCHCHIDVDLQKTRVASRQPGLHTRSLAIEETDARVLKDDDHGWKDARQPLMSAAKRLAISTGQLNTSLCLHLPPIDLVVFQGPSSRTNSAH